MVLKIGVLVAALAGLAGCTSFDMPDFFDREQEIAVSEVPAEVLSAAAQAVKGVRITEASVENEKGQTVYELDGVLDGKEYEIEVSANGEVLEIAED